MAIFHSAIVQRIIRLGVVIFSICFTLENLICSQKAVLSLKCVKMHFLVDYLGAREVCDDKMCGNSSELHQYLSMVAAGVSKTLSPLLLYCISAFLCVG